MNWSDFELTVLRHKAKEKNVYSAFNNYITQFGYPKRTKNEIDRMIYIKKIARN